MSNLDSVPLLLAAAVIGAGLALLVLFVRALRARRRATRRVVEAPNSHYTSKLVQEARTRHRWHDIDLDRVHEINRGEVVRLLGKVEASGMDALRPNERDFLDQMSEIAGTRSEPEPREPGRPLQHLRESPA